MLYSQDDLDGFKESALKGRSPAEYVKQGAASLIRWLQSDMAGDRWHAFGPYWPVVQAVLVQAGYGAAREWGTAPDFLSRYDYGDDFLNLLASLAYLNRDGAYLSQGQPHSVELPDGSEALYLPEIGIVESGD